MENTPTVHILMAVYNGGNYLRQQLDSLLFQTFTNWKLHIRDDNSDDNTIPIIQDYINKHDNISLTVNTTGTRGAVSNFSHLFAIAKAESQIRYVMFCDQDDIWKPNKIERSMNLMETMEARHPKESVLIYTDLEFMDKQSETISGSMNIKHEIQLRTLISYNYVYGCTLLLNRPLIDNIGAIPRDIVNHDFWIALVASLHHSYFLDEKLIRYRRHDSNVSGNLIGNDSWRRRIKRHLVNPEREIDHFKLHINTIAKFFHQYEAELDHDKKKLLSDFFYSFAYSRLAVCYTMLSNRIFRKGFTPSLAPFYQILFFYRKLKPSSIKATNYVNYL